MRLGQRHGAEEASFEHGLQKTLLLLVVGKTLDQVGGAHRQKRIRRGADIGSLKVGKTGLRQQRGQLHAACVEIA